MSAGRLVVPTWFPARDRNGRLVPGAKFTVFENNTTIKAAIYAESGLATPLANPVVANGSGQFPAVFCEAGTTEEPVLYTVGLSGPNSESIVNPAVLNDWQPSVDANVALAALTDAAATSASLSEANAAQSYADIVAFAEEGGRDPGLAARAAKSANGSDFIDPAAVRTNIGAQLAGYPRYFSAAPSQSLSATSALTQNLGLVGSDAAIAGDSGFVGATLFTMAGGSKLAGVALNGSNVDAPTLSWGAGAAQGGAVYAGGESDDYLAGVDVSGKFSDFASGAVNIEYADNPRIPYFEAVNVQTDAVNHGDEFGFPSALEIYHATNLVAGNLVVLGYQRKGVAFNYVEGAIVGNILTSGGASGNACVHGVGSNNVLISGINHDGGDDNGYGPKFVDFRQLVIGPVVCVNANDGFQSYGSHADIACINSLDHVGAALNVDASGVGVQAAAAEVDIIVRGGIRSERGASDLVAASAVVIRADATTGRPIKRVDLLGTTYARGGYSAVYMPVVLGTADNLHVERLDADDLNATGYLYFGLFKNVSFDHIEVGPNVRGGIVAWTHSGTRGGTFQLGGLNLPSAHASFTTEPLVRCGYPGAETFSEAGFKTIIVEDVCVDGAGAANLKLIDLRCHTGDYVKNIVLRRIVGVNLTAATQIEIVLNASATNVRLTIEDVSLTDSSGNPLAISITNADRIVGGSIRNVRATFSAGSRPALCNPLYYQATIDMSALANGSTTTYFPASLTGLALGDSVAVTPRKAKIGVGTVYPYWAAAQIGVNVTNSTGGALTSTELLDIFIDKKAVA